MAGFLQGGGVGKSLAEWMIHGEPEADVFGMDVARFGDYAENKRIHQGDDGQFYSRRFVMTYPNEQLPAGRPLKMAPAHDAMTRRAAAGAQSWDWRCRFISRRSPEFEETPTLKRSNAHDIVAEECKAVREAVGLLDITGLLAVRGDGAERASLAGPDHGVEAARPRPRAAGADAGHDGRLKGDLTVFNWGDGTWWIMGSATTCANGTCAGSTTTWTRASRCAIWDEEMAGFSLAGPNSRKVIERLTEDPWAICPSWAAATSISGCSLQGRAAVGLGRAGL
jgi:dimethylglycine dehydrogenase